MFRRTMIVLTVLAAVCGVSWFYSPGDHHAFVGVSAVCYGYLRLVHCVVLCEEIEKILLAMIAVQQIIVTPPLKQSVV